jgi:glycerol-3-phosphate acyltransferase PlsY
LIAVLFAFFVGALPFSVWIARFAMGQDLREVADGNPGASNVARAGGVKWGALALILDFLKGAVPVSLFYLRYGWRGWPMVLVALAPAFGHAFSPFLRGQGGKALASTVGLWAGLTLGEAPIVLGLFFILWELVLDADGWAVLLGMAGLLGHLLLNHPDPLLFAIWIGNFLLLAWTHRHELSRRPTLRARWRKRL